MDDSLRSVWPRYQPSPKQRKAEIKHQYVALKRRMRTVKQLRDTSLEGSEEKAKHATELRKLTRQYVGLLAHPHCQLSLFVFKLEWSVCCYRAFKVQSVPFSKVA